MGKTRRIQRTATGYAKNTLTCGDCGPAVRRVQTRLTDLSFSTGVVLDELDVPVLIRYHIQRVND